MAKGISGKLGSAKAGATEFVELTAWEASFKCNVSKYNSNTSNGFKCAVAGTRECSGRLEFKYDPANPVMDVIEDGDEVSLTLQANKNTGKQYVVPAVIADLTVNVNIDSGEAESVSCAFEGDGEWTESM